MACFAQAATGIHKNKTPDNHPLKGFDCSQARKVLQNYWPPVNFLPTRTRQIAPLVFFIFGSQDASQILNKDRILRAHTIFSPSGPVRISSQMPGCRASQSTGIGRAIPE